MPDINITDNTSDTQDIRSVRVGKVYRFFSVDGFSFNGLVIAQAPKLTLLAKSGPPQSEHAVVEMVIITGADEKGGLQLIRTSDMRPLQQIGWIAKELKVITIPKNGEAQKTS